MVNILGDKTKISRTALIDGVEVDYDMASENQDAYQELRESGRIQYLGSGVHYRINGTKQNSKRVLHYWKWNK